jgi:hypothetical protein
LDFNTDPDIRPMAILQYSFIIMLVEHMSYTASLSLPADSSIGIYTGIKKRATLEPPFDSTKKYEYLLVANSYCR